MARSCKQKRSIGVILNMMITIRIAASQESFAPSAQALAENPTETVVVIASLFGEAPQSAQSVAKETETQYNTTLHMYLDKQLGKRFNVTFELRQLSWQALQEAMVEKLVDMVLLDASRFVCAEGIVNLHPVANVRARFDVGDTCYNADHYHGAVVVHNDSDITQLSQIRNKVVEATSTHDLGGYQLQWDELERQGASFLASVEQLRTVGAQDDARVLVDVAAGEVDVGFVTAGALQQAEHEGRVAAGELRVLQNLQGSSTDPNCPFPYTTRASAPYLGLSALPWVDWGLRNAVRSQRNFSQGAGSSVLLNLRDGLEQDEVQEIANALFAMTSDDPAAVAGGYVAWQLPSTYRWVREVYANAGRMDASANQCAPAKQNRSDFCGTLACPPDTARKSCAALEESCQLAGMVCPAAASCVCQPCVQVSSKLCTSAATELRDGECVCVKGYVPDSAGTCHLASRPRSYLNALIAVVCAFVLFLLVAAAVGYARFSREESNMSWRIRISELQFAEPPEVLGRGKYGQVLKAEYRGTEVVVKGTFGNEEEHLDAPPPSDAIPPSRARSGPPLTAGSRLKRCTPGSRVNSAEILPILSFSSSTSTSNLTRTSFIDMEQLNGTARVSLDEVTIVEDQEGVVRKHSGDNKEDNEAPFSMPLGTCDSLQDLVSWFDEHRRVSSTGSVAASDAARRSRRSSAGVFAPANGAIWTKAVQESIGTIILEPSKPPRWSMFLGKWTLDSPVMGMRRMLQQEFFKKIQTTMNLRHPNIVTLMGAVVEHGSEPLMVMEFLEQGTMRDLLHNSTISLDYDIVTKLLEGLVSGLMFLHGASPPILHKDIKSANVLVANNFVPKLADYGLTASRMAGVKGTPFWMAPELFISGATPTRQTDVYSFGVTAYEIFVRKEPFQDDLQDSILRRLQSGAEPNLRPQLPAGLPSAVKDFIVACWHTNPQLRPSFPEIKTLIAGLPKDKVNEWFRAKESKRERRRSLVDSDPGCKLSASMLLHNIFPRNVVQTLQRGEKVEPEHHDMVTIFFSDIVGFTDISSKFEPMQVMDMLDRLYLMFDKLSREHDIFKVETIGDAYMAVSNLVKKQDDHTKRIARFAVEAIRMANQTMLDESRPELGCVNIRVGFHSGPVVASVVGNVNPRFCLFGDTVNTASRMESTSEKNRIHMSEAATMNLLNQAPDMDVECRGRIQMKGKGEQMTFWLNPPGHREDFGFSRQRSATLQGDSEQPASDAHLPSKPPMVGRIWGPICSVTSSPVSSGKNLLSEQAL